jgi:four helix bundle protein
MKPPSFDLYDCAVALVVAMRPVVERIRQHDRDLAGQLKRATTSVPSCIAEGRRRTGRDRIYLWNVAAGSADEVRTQLHVALAWGDIDPPSFARPVELVDRICAMLWRATHPSP